jgi:Double zinc ribbon
MARTCGQCGSAMTDAATFCTVCGAEAPPLVQQSVATAPSANGSKFCASCGAALVPGAKFCGSCGTPVGQTVAAPPVPTGPASPPVFNEAEPDTRNRNLIIGAVAAGALLIGILFWINRYSWLGMEPPLENATAAIGTEKTMYVIASANLRDRATSQGSSVVGKLPRGAKVSGVLELGEDGTSNWLKIAESGNYISAVNLSEIEPPALARSLNKSFFASGDTPILAKPQQGAPVLMTAKSGGKLQLVGLTAGGFAEVLLEKGGVGYFDASGIDIEAGSAQPIDVAFIPGGCGFGREVQGLFRKVGQDSQSRYAKAETASYPDEETRTRTLEDLAAKSAYLPLTRSWMGLRVGGIGQHYESVSVYFNEPYARVAEVLGKTYPIDSTGAFTITGDAPTSAGLAPTDDEARKYGMTELSCGV